MKKTIKISIFSVSKSALNIVVYIKYLLGEGGGIKRILRRGAAHNYLVTLLMTKLFGLAVSIQVNELDCQNLSFKTLYIH